MILTLLETLDAQEDPYDADVIVESYAPWTEADDDRSVLAEEARYEAGRRD